MDINKIRSMSDEQLELYLKSLADRNKRTCIKCGKPNVIYTINVQNKKMEQQKKLCSLCDKCYNELLNNLGINDVIWN